MLNLMSLGQCEFDPECLALYDWNCDGEVDSYELGQIRNNNYFGQPAPTCD
jgi:hypothetical protein